MPLELVTVPCLQDNYAFLVHQTESGSTALIDAPEAAPIEAALRKHGWELTDIWLTHHHPDHIDGVEELRAAHSPRVIGAAADAHRLPPLDVAVAEGDHPDFYGRVVYVIEVPGHTVGHIAFHIPAGNLLFTGDSLMALGCGRLFEGTPEQMWNSLSKLAALPPETVVCSGHEYTAANAKFALTIESDNAALQDRARAIAATRAKGGFTVPSTLGDELATNPFLRAGLPSVKTALNMAGEPDAAVFAEIRSRKDRF